MSVEKTTEKPSNYNNLEQMSTQDLLSNINQEDKLVPQVIEKIIPDVVRLVDAAALKLQDGGRLFYIGAGTSGRLGVLDASECPPTYGVPEDLVIGLIAGGDRALRKSIENAEDNTLQGWQDLLQYDISDNDFLVGIAASGTTPYVYGALQKAQEHGIYTGSISCNANSPISQVADFPIEAVVGPEFVTGSTRMKAGTAQKLLLNMISTSVMIKLGRVLDNKMIDMQLSNQKLTERGVQMIMDNLHINRSQAISLLEKHKSVRAALDAMNC